MKPQVILPEDAILINRLRNGDQSAFNQIYDRYYRRLLRRAYNKLHSKDIAEELMHNVFVKLWQRRSELSIHTSLESYLFVILRNEVLQFFRRSSSVEVYIEEISQFCLPADDTTEQRIITNDLQNVLEQHIQQLPEKCQQIFRLSREKQYSVEEIATMLNLSPQTVKNQLSKALYILRTHFKKYATLVVLLLTIR